MGRFDGRTAIVTGAAGGIGEEYAKVVRGQVDRYKDWVELCS